METWEKLEEEGVGRILSYGWLKENKHRWDGGHSGGGEADTLIFSSLLESTVTPETGTGGTFTRASSETYATGLGATDLDYVTSGNPAVAAAPYIGAGTARGLQMSGELKNYALYSEDFSDAVWTAVGGGSGALSALGYTDPDGGTGNNSSVVATGADEGVIQDSGVAAVSKDWVGSVYVRSTTGTLAGKITLTGTGGTPEVASQGFTATTTWQRVHIYTLFTGSATGNANLQITADASGTLVVWGAMLERGYDGGVQGVNSKYPRSYVPTTAATVLTAECALHYPLSNIENKIEGSGTICVWFAHHRAYNSMVSANRNSIIFSIDDMLQSFSINNTQLEFRWSGGAAVRKAMASYSAGEWLHLCVTWEHDGSDFSIELYQNGSSIGTATETDPLPTFSSNMYIGHRSNLAYDEYSANGILHDVRIYSDVKDSTFIGNLYTEGATAHGL